MAGGGGRPGISFAVLQQMLAAALPGAELTPEDLAAIEAQINERAQQAVGFGAVVYAPCMLLPKCGRE